MQPEQQPRNNLTTMPVSPASNAPLALAVVFDDHCVLCSGGVAFILRHERAPTTRFLSMYAAEGAALAARFALIPADLDRTFAVVEGGTIAVQSDAALRIARELKAPWSWLGWAARVVPKRARDAAYRAIAARRYRLFGRSERCFVPPAEARWRFVSDVPSADSP